MSIIDVDHHIFEAIHVIAVLAWMVGMFYLPRLFVYHCSAAKNSEMDLTFQTMERRLMNAIMIPAMIATILLGLFLSLITGHYHSLWLHIKVVFVMAMIFINVMLNQWRLQFVKGNNTHSPLFFKVVNEIITVIFMIIVFLAFLKPFR